MRGFRSLISLHYPLCVQVYNLSELANWRSHYGIGEFIENMKNKAQLTHLSDIK
jgi:hypothetical protein